MGDPQGSLRGDAAVRPIPRPVVPQPTTRGAQRHRWQSTFWTWGVEAGPEDVNGSEISIQSNFTCLANVRGPARARGRRSSFLLSSFHRKICDQKKAVLFVLIQSMEVETAGFWRWNPPGRSKLPPVSLSHFHQLIWERWQALDGKENLGGKALKRAAISGKMAVMSSASAGVQPRLRAKLAES